PVSRHHTVSVPERAPTEISTLSLHDALPIMPGLVLAYTAQEVMARGMGDETVHVGPRAVDGVREEQEHPRSVLAENLLHLAVRRRARIRITGGAGVVQQLVHAVVAVERPVARAAVLGAVEQRVQAVVRVDLRR